MRPARGGEEKLASPATLDSFRPGSEPSSPWTSARASIAGSDQLAENRIRLRPWASGQGPARLSLTRRESPLHPCRHPLETLVSSKGRVTKLVKLLARDQVRIQELQPEIERMANPAAAQLCKCRERRTLVRCHEDRVRAVDQRPGDRFVLGSIGGRGFVRVKVEEDPLCRVLCSQRHLEGLEEGLSFLVGRFEKTGSLL